MVSLFLRGVKGIHSETLNFFLKQLSRHLWQVLSVVERIELQSLSLFCSHPLDAPSFLIMGFFFNLAYDFLTLFYSPIMNTDNIVDN